MSGARTSLVRCPACRAAVPSGDLCARCASPLDGLSPAEGASSTTSAPGPATTTLRQLLHVPSPRPHPQQDDGADAAPGAPEPRTATRHAAGPSAVAVGLACAVVAGYLVLGVPASHTITGSVHLAARGVEALGARCSPLGSTLGEGSDVVVVDGAGSVLGSTHLGSGTFDGSSCVLPFTLRDITDADDYFLTFDGGDEVSTNCEDLVDDDWRVDVS